MRKTELLPEQGISEQKQKIVWKICKNVIAFFRE